MAKRLTVGDVGKVVFTGQDDWAHDFEEGQVVEITEDYNDFQPYLCIDAKTKEYTSSGWLFEGQIVALDAVLEGGR